MDRQIADQAAAHGILFGPAASGGWGDAAAVLTEAATGSWRWSCAAPAPVYLAHGWASYGTS